MAIAFYNNSGSDDEQRWKTNERQSDEMEGNAKSGTRYRPLVTDQKNAKGHSSKYQDQGLAWNREDLKNSRENATHL